MIAIQDLGGSTMMMRNLAVQRTMLLLLLISAAWVQAAQAPQVRQSPVDTPKRILFVGGSFLSYNDYLHNHVRRIAVAADPAIEKSLQYSAAFNTGPPLTHDNVQHLVEPRNWGMKQPFDMVILQGAGTAAVLDAGRRASFREKLIEFNAEITKRGAKTALYMPHASVNPDKYASPDMIRKIEDMSVSLGNEAGVFIIPVGLAFEEAYRQRPGIRLHKEYDGLHPDLLGTYLAACVVYASLYGKSPVGNSYDYYGKVDKETAAFLQKIADETARKFFGR
jgi:hypothetical protein